MCGIVGIIGSRASGDVVTAMAQRLRHRGPDGEGQWSAPGVALGHRRLAIQDPTECGHQPMLLGALALTYNGEIYNHQTLRRGLKGPWHSTGDTETLLHLLEGGGVAALERLAGMFAFGLWDGASRSLLLVRDRLGMKPLYYQLFPDGIAFASELKALLVLGKPPIDRSAVRDFLFHGYIPAPKTIYQGIAKLPAGHTLTWADGRVAIERYWRPSPAVTERSEGDVLLELDGLLQDVVPAHTLSDVPVGVFLSGGMDSALTAYYLDKPRTFSLGFDARDRSELDAARAASRHLATLHTELTAPMADFAAAVDRLVEVFEEPFVIWSRSSRAARSRWRSPARAAMRFSAGIRAIGRASARARTS
jgi:asparagine synthase (glutamine-hydrolysing)